MYRSIVLGYLGLLAPLIQTQTASPRRWRAVNIGGYYVADPEKTQAVVRRAQRSIAC